MGVWQFIQDQVLGCDFIYTKLFPARAKQADFRALSRHLGKYYFCFAGNSDAILFLLVYSAVYRFFQCRAAAWGDIFFSDLITNGRSGKSCTAYEYFRNKGCCDLCFARPCNRCGWRYAYRKTPYGKVC